MGGSLSSALHSIFVLFVFASAVTLTLLMSGALTKSNKDQARDSVKKAAVTEAGTGNTSTVYMSSAEVFGAMMTQAGDGNIEYMGVRLRDNYEEVEGDRYTPERLFASMSTKDKNQIRAGLASGRQREVSLLKNLLLENEDNANAAYMAVYGYEYENGENVLKGVIYYKVARD